MSEVKVNFEKKNETIYLNAGAIKLIPNYRKTKAEEQKSNLI